MVKEFTIDMKRQISMLWSAKCSAFVSVKHDLSYSLRNCVGGPATEMLLVLFPFVVVAIAVCAADVDDGFTLISYMHDQIDDWNACTTLDISKVVQFMYIGIHFLG